MMKRVQNPSHLSYSVGRQVVTLRDVIAPNSRISHPRGSIGVVIKGPRDLDHVYRVQFLDGVEEPLMPSELTLLAKHKEGDIGDSSVTHENHDLFILGIANGADGDLLRRTGAKVVLSDLRGFSAVPSDVDAPAGS